MQRTAPGTLQLPDSRLADDTPIDAVILAPTQSGPPVVMPGLFPSRPDPTDNPSQAGLASSFQLADAPTSKE